MAGRKLRAYACEGCGTAFQSRGAAPRFCSKSCATTMQHRDNARPAFVCEHCGVAFTVPPSEAARRVRRFCSQACYEAERAPRGKPVERRCEQCGASFNAPLWQFDKAGYKGRFCSNDCCNASHVGVKRVPLRHCRQCGKDYYPYTKTANVQFCSRACHMAWKSAHAWGCKYYGLDWPEQSRKARERDQDTCQDCGKQQHSPALDVHHIRPRRLFRGVHVAANALDNLLTLCRSCHRRREAAVRRAYPLYQAA